MEVKGQQCIVKVVERSSYPHKPDLWTLQLRYPRMIHAEFMTHRVFSRNASSSRAIPVKKMLEQVRTNPAMPARFGYNKPGMQDGGEVDLTLQRVSKELWLDSAKSAADYAESLSDLGLHKQICNRVIEPFQFISVVVTATEWDNFFALRDHEAADPTMYDLAHTMRAAMELARTAVDRNFNSRYHGSWHLPYVRDDERQFYTLEELQKFSVARCARVSYLNHDGTNPDIEKDKSLYLTLLDSGHMSPFEHQACSNPMGGKANSNLKGWTQLRKIIEPLLVGGES